LSGKGGVGKSTVASQLALCFVEKGFKVGLLDVDLCGPSIPRVLGMEDNEICNSSGGWVPVYFDKEKKLSVMSIGFLVEDRDKPIVWRGPRKTTMIGQFIFGVCWGELDYLIIDTPPGTSDEHITVAQKLKEYNPDGAIIVTTPQEVSLSDVIKEISFCKEIEMPILGIIENMSGYICNHCQCCTNIFGKGGGESLAEKLKLEFIGRIPIDPNLSQSLDIGENYVKKKLSLITSTKRFCR